MGFNTTIVVLNDALRQIEEDKDFGKKLVEGILKKTLHGDTVYVSAGNHANPVTIVEMHHADSNHLVMVGGNTGTDLGYVSGYRLDPETDEGKQTLLRNLAFKFGYHIAIKQRRSR